MLVLYRRRWGVFYLPVLLAAGVAIWASARYLLPLPPRSIPIAAGVPGGGYAQMAERYRVELERRGIAADILTSEQGAMAPILRLANRQDAAQAGFAHGLLADRGPEAAVHALAVIGKQPAWIFTHHSGAVQLPMLRGLRIAAGPLGGAQRQVAQQLLAQAQVRDTDVTWSELQGLPAANALLEQQVDATIIIGSSDSPTVRLLARSPGIHMLGVERANALAAREPRLRPFVLPQGAIELRGNVPPRDLTLLYTATHLVVRETMHPALQRARLDAATEIHSTPSFLQHQAEYPDFQADFPLSPVARRYADGNRPWLETVLPYWWAQLAELVALAVVPILALTLLALLWIPRLFSLRVAAMLSHYYGELKFIEDDLEKTAVETPIAVRAVLAKLDRMEHDVAQLDLPDRYVDRWYTLREHLWAARERLLTLRSR
jgi:TRAP-type uncharacterized transport system substrate-binding protein